MMKIFILRMWAEREFQKGIPVSLVHTSSSSQKKIKKQQKDKKEYRPDIGRCPWCTVTKITRLLSPKNTYFALTDIQENELSQWLLWIGYLVIVQ